MILLWPDLTEFISRVAAIISIFVSTIVGMSYMRWHPIAQRRITWIGEGTVRFSVKDKRLGRKVEKQCSLEEFIDRWAQHIPERYQHAVRSFGLFAPRAVGQTSAGIFAILGQERKQRPKPRPWAESVKRDFGHDLLLDHTGKRMKWVRRLTPKGVSLIKNLGPMPLP